MCPLPQQPPSKILASSYSKEICLTKIVAFVIQQICKKKFEHHPH